MSVLIIVSMDAYAHAGYVHVGAGMTLAKKRCFVVQQMGGDGSPERKHADHVLNKVIKPATGEKGYVAKRVDQMNPAGVITEAIIEALGSSPLAIVDLAGLNANVMYELGVRQAWNLPLVLIAPDVKTLPFDILGINTLAYGDLASKASIDSAVNHLKARITSVERDGGIPRIFADMFKKVREPFEMDPIRRAAHWAMHDLVAALRERIKEVDDEVDKVSDEALKKLATLVRPPFSSARDKRHVLVEIAENANDGILVKQLKALDDIAKMGDQVSEMLESGPRTSRTLKNVQSELERIKDRAQRLADRFKSDG